MNNIVKAAFLILLLLAASVIAQPARIIIDENFEDWSTVQPIYQDAIGDQLSGSLDFSDIYILNDEDYLFLNIKVGAEINLQSNNSITLYIDTDENISTGLLVEGIGAELEYTFGSRRGTVRLNGITKNIRHEDIGVIAAPTVTSNTFELSLNRNTDIPGLGILFSSPVIKVVLKDNGSGRDKLPDESGGIEYNFNSIMPEYSHSYSVKKSDGDLRVMTYNVEFDGLFDPSNIPHFTRIFKAAEPDIIIFEEIYNKSSQQTADLIETMIPSNDGEHWFNSKQGNDIIVVSKFPVTASSAIDGNGAFLLDLTSRYDSELLVVGAHPPCCDNDFQRQQEIDSIMAFVRNSKNGIGEIPITEGTPILIAGDMNLVGLARQLNTFITGDIFNESQYGPDFNPDWDGGNFEDAKPKVTNSPHVFTWYDEGNFGPGRLDFIFYSGSVMELTNSYTMFTNSMDEDTLTAYNLNKFDATSASDHLPVVADFTFPGITSASINTIIPNEFRLMQNYPNPFNPKTTIEFSLPNSKKGDSFLTKMNVYDILGNEVAQLINQSLSPGNHKINFNIKNLSTGIYIYQLLYDDYSASKKMIVLK
ncbi:MAG: T9SS type A sorting domain-containing protein [Ignavibacteriae bacterium]|nr:T9SS type A sorting domain-containing protein [Ignavibacteriota bacterium]